MSDAYWYKDAVIYEVHVRAFYDGNNDGSGDVAGLTEKLPYLQDLGVTCLWLLPFYPSPLRDDGYDIADYTSINPIYGTLDDFKRLVDQAHARNIHVLTELVINHTSDQHPWFQRARRAPKGSPEREYYVWSDTTEKYAGTRVIFTDSEKSNWTFDPLAGQYYWHRFFWHQPDLNLDNPQVLRAVLDVMRFWFKLGVDGMRLDAIPYLIEREGTINENLPETHAVLKTFRRAVDAEFPGRVLLAEANQWPADVRAYFGDGDECHMAFHFPLMPRMFMALQQEERHGIVEIVNQTPEIPENCQWALFLRNHDELTLEMVTDEERDYMHAQYAADPQMRINGGIRRRLAPLMENSRRRIELMNYLLFTMPGTPIVYYGDEIGMGDNIYLGDRNGVRTPMQWSSDRNGGFSRVDPARIFAPVIMDPIYGYEAINVEAQERSPFSLLHWMKRLIALRRQRPVFGRGSIEFIPTTNRKVLVYARRYEGDTVLCVANLGRTVQPVEINLERFAGLTPVEMTGQTAFPRVTEHPYFLTLAPYGFYWFQLQDVVTPMTFRVAPVSEEPAAVPALLSGVVWDDMLDGGMRRIIERQALVAFLTRQPWFCERGRSVTSAQVVDWSTLRKGAHPSFLAIVEARFGDGGVERYLLPLALSSGTEAERIQREHPGAVVALVAGARKGVLYDGLFEEGTCAILLASVQESRAMTSRHGHILAANIALTPERAPADALTPIVHLSPAPNTTSVKFGTRVIMKIFRRLEPGRHPETEMGQFLARQHFTRTPLMMGTIEYDSGDGPSASVVVLHEFVTNQGSAWRVTIEELGRYFERAIAVQLPTANRDEVIAELIGAYASLADVLGRRTGELHAVAGQGQEDGFGRVEYTVQGVKATVDVMRTRAAEHFAILDRTAGHLDERHHALAQAVLDRRDDLLRQISDAADVLHGGMRVRCHGDYHLGRVLVTEGDVIILNFEGDPARPIVERRKKQSPLRDVAGMLRSFSYVALTALEAATVARPEDRERLAPWADLWERWITTVFLRGYLAAVAPAGLLPTREDDLTVLLQAFVIDKALDELAYELNNRPDWIQVPLTGLLRLQAPLRV
jgi:maltose alpha-D-glucosyltransferase/alpha-amylase